MIVLRENFHAVLASLYEKRVFSCDTETYGLSPFKGDRLFSIVIHDGTESFYFNFNPYPNVEPECVLPYSLCSELNKLTSTETSLWYMHNAKFDLHMLENEGIEFNGEIHCTESTARLVYNDHIEYNLAACAERIGYKKDDTVEAYILKNNLWKWEAIPGKKTRTKNLFFSKVPLSLIQPYGEQDALITYKLGEYQREELGKIALTSPPNKPNILQVYDNEKRLTKTCAKIERAGIMIDRDYCEKAIIYEQAKYDEATEKFRSLTGEKFVDSNKALADAFTKLGETFPTTAKGNPSFTDEVLEGFTTPVAKIVQELRSSQMRCNTYFRSFLHHADRHDRIHANMKQSGTKTGRFSYSDPNLQNLPKEDESPFPVRRAFIPAPGKFFTLIDYKQMEFRLMLDYAGQTDLIDRILAGHDPHEATAELVRAMGTACTRRDAKIINFGIAYGMGAEKLGVRLGKTKDEASRFRRQYFEALPKVKAVINGATKTAEKRGFVFNWYGRRFQFPDPKFSYRAFNAIDQGGCADVVKIAMNQIQELHDARKPRSQMVLQVHDEIVFETTEDEQDSLVPKWQWLMENVYAQRFIPLACDVSHSYRSLYDVEKGANRNTVQEENSSEAKRTPEYVGREDTAGCTQGNP
jgi:DNA polymerase I